jgi:hypothetical protein
MSLGGDSLTSGKLRSETTCKFGIRPLFCEPRLSQDLPTANNISNSNILQVHKL